MPSIMPMRRKKWTEEEEETLINKYGEMLASGVLAKMKTRERKFQPIAAQVNVMHHAQDPIAFPWQWTWKDASTKVQNMRHQYLGVKQKIRKIVTTIDSGEREEYDWGEGLTHWSNFLKYKEVFGDVELDFSEMGNGGRIMGGVGSSGRGRFKGGFRHPMGNNQMGGIEDGVLLRSMGLDGNQGGGLLGLGLGFEYEGEEGEENGIKVGDEYEYEEVEACGGESSRKKRRGSKTFGDGFGRGGVESRILGLLSNQFGQLREREIRREEQEVERERERQKREIMRAEAEQEQMREREEWEKEREEQEQMREKEREVRYQLLESRAKEREAREQQRREEEMRREREWEERMEQRRLEWRKVMETMIREHQAAMAQLQSQIVQSQQSVISQLLGIVLHYTGQAGDLSDHTGAGNQFVNQILQSLQHCGGGGIVPSGNRGTGGGSDTQFIVDG